MPVGQVWKGLWRQGSGRRADGAAASAAGPSRLGTLWPRLWRSLGSGASLGGTGGLRPKRAPRVWQPYNPRRRNLRRFANSIRTYPEDPLLYVPSDPARSLDRALKAAGIPKVTEAGKVDFHACRVAYIIMLFENGATLKKAQELAQHITPHLTTNVYAKVRDERLAELVEQVGEALVSTAKHAPRMHGKITRTDNVSIVSGDKDNAEGGI